MRTAHFREKHIYNNELDKDFFAHGAAYSDSKDLANKSISDKILKDRAYEIAINRKYDRYQRGLRGMVYKFFDKAAGSKATRKVCVCVCWGGGRVGGGGGVNGTSVNGELSQESHKPVIKKFKKRKVYARFKDNI